MDFKTERVGEREGERETEREGERGRVFLRQAPPLRMQKKYEQKTGTKTAKSPFHSFFFVIAKKYRAGIHNTPLSL